MYCYWYDPNYKIGTCTESIGDAVHDCECNGDVDLCPYGKTVAFVREIDSKR